MQANKREREKAKRERKEARKLAEPMPIMTQDARPRAFLNDTERQETLEWIAERKSRYPTKESLAKKLEAEAAVARSGKSTSVTFATSVQMLRF